MNKNIYLIGGCKGGVGKSLVSMSIIDFLLDKKQKVTLFETDLTNPDVLKTYKKIIPTELVDLDGPDGWIDMINAVAEIPDHVIVINTAARNNKGIASHSETLTSIIPELKRNLITLWVINRQRDSLELLSDYIETVQNTKIHVICNEYFGPYAKFNLYKNSKIKAKIEASGGKSISFPELADRIADDLYNNRYTIADALKNLPIGNRAELIKWKSSVTKILGAFLNE
jgi:hypothetical protein